MSAIAGTLYFDKRPQALAAVTRIASSLKPLGSERTTFWDDGDVALVSHLSSLLPEDRFDEQPCIGGDGRVLVTAVRLDNRDELCDALATVQGARATLADSAIVLAAYERWGEACLDRLIGEFVFGAWHPRERRLFCARSHLGGPPFYYHRARHFFAFATTANALFALPDIPRALDEERLARHIALWPEAGRSFYKDIACLPPGHCLTIADGKIECRRYWRLDISKRLVLAHNDDYAEALRERFDAAVRARLRSSRPIGTQLSSGFDSAAVAMTASRLLNGNGKLAAFTAAPPENFAGKAPNGRPVDEAPLAREISARLPNVEHVILRADGQGALDNLDRANLLHGRPLLNLCNQSWIDQIYAAARDRKIGVLLTGQMGNMSISYDGMTRLPALFGAFDWLTLLHECTRLARAGRRWRQLAAEILTPYMARRLFRAFMTLARRPGARIGDYSALDPVLAKRLAGEDTGVLHPWKDGRALRRFIFERFDTGDARNAALAGWGLDVRDPTADRRLVEFCLAIPEEQFLKNGQTRALYRRAFGAGLPDAVLNAGKRGYQGANWYENLTASRAEIAGEIARLESSPAAKRVLDLPRLRNLVAAWPSDGWDTDDVIVNYRYVLSRGLAVGRFIRWVEGGNA